MCDTNQAMIILKKVYEEDERILGVINQAFLYGSYARGDYSPESDVDIMLLVPMSQEEIADHRMSLAEVSSRLSLEHDVTVSVMVEPEEQFNRYKNLLPFYKNVLNEGVRYAG